MRPAFRRGWEGEGKLNRCPGAGQRAHSDRHTGATILLWEMRGQSPWRSHQSGNGADQAPPAATRHRQRHPCTARRRRGEWRLAKRGTRLLSQRDSAASYRERAAVARPTRKEVSVPCGSAKQHRALGSAKRGKERDLKPSRSSSHVPDRHPNGPGPQARSAPVDRAGCPKGSFERPSRLIIFLSTSYRLFPREGCKKS